ncbi:lysoplasmalogenase TMEM86A-like [Brachionichthys hirsutus]|uniref:lysoplasmalogenase TMEM86A-like n=1 Tax=Brachionichthys hirsutus TaxID=412623 RepID=UPI003604E7BE
MDILETDAYDRRQRSNMSCALLFSLLPFFLSTALYFYLWTPGMPASMVSAGVKSAPTFLLAAVVLSWNGSRNIPGVLGGLVFSAVGDCCLVWPELFLHGMGAFAVAHLLYSLTFLSSRYAARPSSSGMRFLYLILCLIGGGFYIGVYPFLLKAQNADVLIPAVGVYVVLITLMGILAIRTRHTPTLLGSLSFIVSDLSLAVQVFKVMPPTEHGSILVMTTYYLAQLLIAVGDIDAGKSKESYPKWKRY